MEQVIEIRGARKRYKGFELKGVSFDVPRGYIMGLIGPNGAGKTTLMKAVMNLVRLEAGTVRVFGMDSSRDEARIKARIGYVPDEPACHEDMRLATIASAVAPFYASWDRQRFLSLADEFELPLGKKWRTLSQGMKTKFSLALALCHDAELILLDEPTSGLDPVFRRELLERLSAIIQDEHRSVLFSTHITADLERIADYITFVRAGELVFSSPKDEVLERWAVARGGTELLAPELRSLFRAVRRGPHGVEALTANAAEARRRLNSHAVVERASLEDIMVLLEKGD
jgi:ABC-2 type transport system ATP-binding protein